MNMTSGAFLRKKFIRIHDSLGVTLSLSEGHFQKQAGGFGRKILDGT